MSAWSETVWLDNGDGTGWRVDPDGWSHPTVKAASGWEDTGGTPLPPDPNPHPVAIDWPPVNQPGSGVVPTD